MATNFMTNKKTDTKVKVCFMSAFDMNADAFREKFPTLDLNVLFQSQFKLMNS